MSTTSISWNDVAGTIWGGELNVKTGELTVNRGYVNLGTLEWINKTFTSQAKGFSTKYSLSNGKPVPGYSGIMSGAICSIYPIVTNGSMQNTLSDMCMAVGAYYSLGCFVYVRDSRYTDATAFKQMLADNNVQLVYELATPVTYQLTPTEIRSLLGTNNVWANCGAITELKYTRDLNLCINDIIARIEALEGASNTRSLSLSPTLTKSLISDSDTAEGKTEETEEETKEEAQKNER